MLILATVAIIIAVIIPINISIIVIIDMMMMMMMMMVMMVMTMTWLHVEQKFASFRCRIDVETLCSVSKTVEIIDTDLQTHRQCDSHYHVNNTNSNANTMAYNLLQRHHRHPQHHVRMT
jgi:hypothetical protein